MSSFQIGATTATFQSTVNGARQTSGDLPQLTVGILWSSEADWLALLSLVTTKYALHVPMAGTVILDVVRGPGTGTLVIDGLGTTDALLTQLERAQYIPNEQSVGTASFLITGVPI